VSLSLQLLLPQAPLLLRHGEPLTASPRICDVTYKHDQENDKDVLTIPSPDKDALRTAPAFAATVRSLPLMIARSGGACTQNLTGTSAILASSLAEYTASM
jgi:hypothetical protein